MDNAVALVQTYLHVNGYFTVSEFPVIEAKRQGGYRAVTDLDILAFRFPGAGRLIPKADGGWLAGTEVFAPDPALGVTVDRADMLIGEVKEGRAEINAAARDPMVLRTALTRFGCCTAGQAPEVVAALMRDGRTELPSGHRLRLVAFGIVPEPLPRHAYDIVGLGQVVRFLKEYLREHWDVLHTAQFKDPAFGFLVTLEKALRDRAIDGSEP